MALATLWSRQALMRLQWIRVATFCITSVFRTVLFVTPLHLSAETTNQDFKTFEQATRLATVYEQKGFRQQAAATLLKTEQTLELTQKQHTALSLILARLYFELGEYPLSSNRLEQILAANKDHTRETSIDIRSKIAALNIRAAVASTLNNPTGASTDYKTATDLAEKSGLHLIKTISQTNHFRHELDHNHHRAAKSMADPIYDSAKDLEPVPVQIELRISVAELLMQLAHRNGNSRYRSQAIELLEVAADHADLRQLTRLKSFAIGYHGQALLESGDPTVASSLLNTAVFLAFSVDALESAYLWQWQLAKAQRLQGETALALKSYRTAISTLEHIRADLITGSPFTFPRKIQPLYAELSELLLSAARQTELRSAQQDYLTQVQAVLEQAKSAELQDYFQNDCVIPDEVVDLSNIAEATAVVYPVVLQNRLEILINIDDEIHQYQYAINSKDLERLVNDFRDNLQRDQGDDEYKIIGEELYDILFAQASTLLKENSINTLLVIPDGSLRTIPFAAIYDGDQFLIEKYAIATTPGISLTLPKPLDIQEASLFAGGISDAVQGFSGLPGVPVELQRLQERHGAEILQDQHFHKNAIQDQLSSENYSIVHIATHGHFDSNPQKSFLLTYDDKLTMDLLEKSIGSRRLTGNPLELLVLSACETAVGDSRAALGLAGVALKAGARSAVATLWQISDEATVEVIQTFYQQTTNQQKTKAEALRLAQIQLLTSDRFYHPTDWAPFLLIGNWL